jgi:hypothetical protein
VLRTQRVAAALLVILELLPVEIPAHPGLRVQAVPQVPEVSAAPAIMVVTLLVALVAHQDLVVAADPPMEAWVVTAPLVSPS